MTDQSLLECTFRKRLDMVGHVQPMENAPS